MRQGTAGNVLINNCTRNGFVMCKDFMQHEMTIMAGLTVEEVIALRLYTGPVSHKYNMHLRFGLGEGTKEDGAPPLQARGTRAKKGRHYTTTIHAIASALKKVARFTELPEVSRHSLFFAIAFCCFLSFSLSIFLFFSLSAGTSCFSLSPSLVGSIRLRAS